MSDLSGLIGDRRHGEDASGVKTFCRRQASAAKSTKLGSESGESDGGEEPRILSPRPQMKEKRDLYRFLHITARRIYEQLEQAVRRRTEARQEVLAVAACSHDDWLAPHCSRSSAPLWSAFFIRPGFKGRNVQGTNCDWS